MGVTATVIILDSCIEIPPRAIAIATSQLLSLWFFDFNHDMFAAENLQCEALNVVCSIPIP